MLDQNSDPTQFMIFFGLLHTLGLMPFVRSAGREDTDSLPVPLLLLLGLFDIFICLMLDEIAVWLSKYRLAHDIPQKKRINRKDI